MNLKQRTMNGTSVDDLKMSELKVVNGNGSGKRDDYLGEKFE